MKKNDKIMDRPNIIEDLSGMPAWPQKLGHQGHSGIIYQSQPSGVIDFIVQKVKLGRDNYYINTDLYNLLSNVNQIKHV